MYKKQPDILHAIANGISDIQEELDVSFYFILVVFSFILIIFFYQEYIQCREPVYTCFDSNVISFILQVRVPSDMIASIKNFSIGSMIKLKCSLGYSQTMQSLLLVLDSDVISMVN